MELTAVEREIDEHRTGEIELDARPEPVVLVGRHEVPHEQALRGQPHFALLQLVAVAGVSGAGQLVRHPQVGADHIGDRLAQLGVVLRQAVQRVQAGEPDRCLLRTQLFHGFQVELVDAPFGGVVPGGPVGLFPEPQFGALRRQVVLSGLLPPRREHQRQGAAGADHDRPDGADAAEPSAVGVGAVAVQGEQDPAGRRRDRHHQYAAQCDRPVGQRPARVRSNPCAGERFRGG
ncbi:hypothetical protein AB0K15_06860 [Amycolatopsis sp. NPDC049253]|uniref:hypothetical protein n=1 Tax=Amycolatopsis sp. NPDC049253 TaxID=3155274 RepID=UPI0034361046